MKKTLITVASASLLALALTACSSGGVADAEPTRSTSSTAASTPTSAAPTAEALVAAPVNAFPVGNAFEEATWEVKASRGADVRVTADRLVVKDWLAPVVRAWSAEGEEVWTYDAPMDASIRLLGQTIAIVDAHDSKGAGLDKTTQVITVTLLDLDDGSVVAEVEVPDSDMDGDSLAFASKRGADGSDGPNWGLVVAEDGTTREFDLAEDRSVTGNLRSVDGTPVWLARGELRGESWTSADLGLAEHGVLAMNDSLGLLLLWDGSPFAASETVHAIRAETGERAFDVTCATGSGLETSLATGGPSSSTSPNGRFAVKGPVSFSSDKAVCLGGGDQQSVSLTAVDDDGTSYGVSAEGDLVVAPLDGDLQVSTLPSGASTPLGIMTGGIAVHWDQASGYVTGNPIAAR